MVFFKIKFINYCLFQITLNKKHIIKHFCYSLPSFITDFQQEQHCLFLIPILSNCVDQFIYEKWQNLSFWWIGFSVEIACPILLRNILDHLDSNFGVNILQKNMYITSDSRKTADLLSSLDIQVLVFFQSSGHIPWTHLWHSFADLR